jgi:4-hydroxy-3-methylbut-2-enyl diphosphate reductase
MKNNIELIDASCPVVLKLQNRVRHAYEKMKQSDGQVVIYGKKGHAEVIGLTGQTKNEAIIITDEQDLDKIDFNRPVVLYSQTTKSTTGFYRIKELIEKRITDKNGPEFEAHDSICRQVSNREPQLKKFASEHDLILFVSGKKSSNGKALYQVVKDQNPRSYFIEYEDEVDPEWFNPGDSVGICGATSTPMWLMKEIASYMSGLEDQNRIG